MSLGVVGIAMAAVTVAIAAVAAGLKALYED
jgi:hypothetical protein